MDLNSIMSRLVLFSRSLVRSPVILGQQLSGNTNNPLKAANETLSVPPRPKKPITPWLMFVRDKKDELLRGQKMSAAEISSSLAKDWKYYDKTSYQTEYNRLHLEYLSAKVDYEQSLTPEQRQQLQDTEKSRTDLKATRDLRRTKPPKLPRNSANFYFAERSNEPDLREKLGAHTHPEVMSKVFKEYASLSPEEKEKYVKMQEKDKERFRQEFLSWYESVMSDKSNSRLMRAKAEAMRTRFKLLSYI